MNLVCAPKKWNSLKLNAPVWCWEVEEIVDKKKKGVKEEIVIPLDDGWISLSSDCIHQEVNLLVTVVTFVSDGLWMCSIEWNNDWLLQRNLRLPM